MPPPETYKSEIGSQSTMCQVHTGAYVSLLAPGQNRQRTPLATQERLPRVPGILHVVSITTHTHDRRKSGARESANIGRKEKPANTKNACLPTPQNQISI